MYNDYSKKGEIKMIEKLEKELRDKLITIYIKWKNKYGLDDDEILYYDGVNGLDLIEVLNNIELFTDKY